MDQQNNQNQQTNLNSPQAPVNQTPVASQGPASPPPMPPINPVPTPPPATPSAPQVMVHGKGSKKNLFIILGLAIIIIAAIFIYAFLASKRPSQVSPVPQPQAAVKSTPTAAPTLTPIPTATLDQQIQGISTDTDAVTTNPDLQQVNTDLQQL